MADDVAEVAYAVAFDGVPKIFVDNDGLNNTWAATAGFASAFTGLIRPASLPCAVDLRLGELSDSDAVIEIDDIDGTLAALFGSSIANAETLMTTLEPGTDPAPDALDSMHVGHEAIGSAGQRRRYSCVPGYNVGLRHLGYNHAYAIGQGPTPVTANPVLWPGRRVAVYRVKKIGGTWQALSAAERVWFGSLLGQGSHDAGTWSFKCAGPESWASGNLGSAAWETPLECEPLFSLKDGVAAGEELVTVSIQLVQLDDTSVVHHTWQASYGADIPGGTTTYTDLVQAINDILDAAQTDATSGDAYQEGNSQVRYSTSPGHDGFIVEWNRDAEDASAFDPVTANDEWVVRFQVGLHEKVWAALGYDVRQQSGADPVDQPEAFALFSPVGTKGRWIGDFFSADKYAMAAYMSEGQDFSGLQKTNYTNGQAERRWPPLFAGGGAQWSGQVGQEFTFDTDSPVFMPSSLSRPLMADPDDPAAAFTIGGDIGPVTHTGLIVITGPYRRRGDTDKMEAVEGYAFELERERREGKTVQVARVCWREVSDGSLAVDADSRARLVIYRWEDPKLFGFDYSKFTGSWAAWRDPPVGSSLGFSARPLVVFDHGDAGDRIDRVMQRVLATTGTAVSWFSDSGLTIDLYGLNPASAFLEAGANDYATGAVPFDAEVAEMGLGVPASMIQDEAAWTAAVSVVGPNLRRCKAAFGSNISANKLMRTLLSPTGLCMSLAGGKFGIFDPWSLPTPEEADAEIDAEWYAGKAGDPTSAIPKQEFRVLAPIDWLDVKARIEPYEGKPFRTFQRKATDMGARYRSQTIPHAITGDHLVHPQIPNLLGASWTSELSARWKDGFAFWGLQHFAVPLDLHAEDAIGLWPGNSILLTDEWLADPAGEYGLNIAAGWVVSRTFDARNERVLLKVMINAETDFRMYAPAALATRYDEDEEDLGYRLAVADDWLGFRAGVYGVDCQGFAEPTWSIEGGDALIEIFQFDAVSWTRGIFGTVGSVTAAENDCWLNLTGALTGATFYSDMHHVVVLREFADQAAAWVLQWFAPVCLEDGTHSTGEDGIKLRI